MRATKTLKKTKCLELRPHQRTSIDQTVRALTSGRDMLVSKPTGSGKSCEIMALVARLLPLGWRVVITAPQVNILGNFLNEGEEAWTHIKAGSQVIDISGKALVKEKVDAKDVGRYLVSGGGVALCMTQQALVAYTKKKRLPTLEKCILIVDEFHHAAADGFEAVVSEWRNQGGLVAGYTATPWRMDGRDVGWLNDRMSAYYLSLADHMSEKDDEGFGKYCPRNLHSEFVAYEANEVTDDNYSGNTLTEEEAESIAESVYAKWAHDKKPKFVLYYQSSTIQRNRQVREAIIDRFEGAGECLLDSTGAEGGEFFNQELEAERGRTCKESKYAGIIGCGRVREGMDWPLCSAVYVIGMPTSTNLLVQLFGRACRKKDANYKPASYRDVAEISFFLPSADGKAFDKISQVHSWNTLAVCFFLTDSSLGQRSIPIRKVGSGIRKAVLDTDQEEALEEEVTGLSLAADATVAGRTEDNEVLLQVIDLAEQGLYLNEIAEFLVEKGYDEDVVKAAITRQGMLKNPETAEYVEKESCKAAKRQLKVGGKINVPQISKEVFKAYVQEFRELTLKGSEYAKGVAKQLHQVGGVKALVERLQADQGTPATDEQILRWARNYLEREGKAPSQISGLVDEYDSSALRWAALDLRLRKQGSSLHKFCVEYGLRDIAITCTDEQILQWAIAYNTKNGTCPSCKSGFIGESDSGALTWGGLDQKRRIHKMESLSTLFRKQGLQNHGVRISDEEAVSETEKHLKGAGSYPSCGSSGYWMRFHGQRETSGGLPAFLLKYFNVTTSERRRLSQIKRNASRQFASIDEVRKLARGITKEEYNEIRKSKTEESGKLYPDTGRFPKHYGMTFTQVRDGHSTSKTKPK